MIAVLPMAGRGTRMSGLGEDVPKPLLDVAGKPMVLRALESLRGLKLRKLVCVILSEHEVRFNVENLLRQAVDCQIRLIKIPEVTEGQLCTVLAAKGDMVDDEDLLVLSSDTYVRSGLGPLIAKHESRCAGIISVMEMPGDHWSFVRADDNGQVLEVAEKKRISSLASTGIYYFSNCKQFITAAEQVVAANKRVGGEFYVMPVYQQYLAEGKVVISHMAEEMWDMGTPTAKAAFETYLTSKME